MGAIMVHLEVGPAEAFARLCALAYSSKTPIGVVAGEILGKRLRLEPD